MKYYSNLVALSGFKLYSSMLVRAFKTYSDLKYFGQDNDSPKSTIKYACFIIHL